MGVNCFYLLLNGSNQFVHLLGYIVLHGWQDMGIGIHRYVDLGVPQPLLDDLRVDPFPEHQRCSRMSQVMKADIGQASFSQYLLELPVHIAMIEAGTGLRSEDHAMILPPFTGKCTQTILLPEVFIQYSHHRLAENHHPTPGGALRLQQG